MEGEIHGAAKELGRRYGGNWRLGNRIGTARHGITYRDIRVAVHRGEIGGRGEIREGPEAGWFADEEIGRLASSSLVGKILSVRDRPSGRRSSRPPG